MNGVTNIVHFYGGSVYFFLFLSEEVQKSSFVKNSDYLSFLLTSKETNLFSIDNLEGTGQ
jgi:hypothetical protein